MKKLPWHNFSFLVILSLSGAIGILFLINASASELVYSNSMASFLLFLAWLYLLKRLTDSAAWKEIRALLTPCLIFMLCFSGSMAAGVQLDREGAVKFGDWKLYVCVFCTALAAAPVLGAVIRKLREYGTAGNRKCFDVTSGRTFLFIWGVLFLAYIPTFLASFPGFFTYDAEAETYMVFTDKYSTYQPLPHVLLLGWMIRILYSLTGSYNVGIMVYILLQMLILSACFAYEIYFLRKAGVRRWICNLGLVFLALFPTVSMFVCCSTKDTLFSGGVILFVTLLLELARDGERFWNSRLKKAMFIVSILFILCFRNNGMYALVLFLLFFAIRYRRTWRKWLPALTTAFLIFIIITWSLVTAFHAEKGPLAEMLCVPIQQLARVHTEAENSLTKEDSELLYSLIPKEILEQYNPKLADMVKVNFLEDNFKKSPGKYILLWIRLGLKHFDIYVNAFLENTYGYWYPDTILDGYRGLWVFDRQYEDSSYFAFTMEPPGSRTSLLPALEGFYEKISLEIYQQRLPVVSMLFSVGFWHWIYLFTAFYLLAFRHRKQLLSLAFIGLLYLTVLLGPIALVRYVLYLFFAVPLVLALAFDPGAVAGFDFEPKAGMEDI